MPESIDRFDGQYRWLSNFWPVPEGRPIVTADGEYGFHDVETAYQWAKFWPHAKPIADLIHTATSPAQAKRDARKHAKHWRKDWDAVKVDVMRRLLRQKFADDSELAAKLLATGDTELVEGNLWGDTFWGVCQGVGQNWLGRLLMERRRELRK